VPKAGYPSRSLSMECLLRRSFVLGVSPRVNGDGTVLLPRHFKTSSEMMPRSRARLGAHRGFASTICLGVLLGPT
jgi:hypothetical protein